MISFQEVGFHLELVIAGKEPAVRIAPRSAATRSESAPQFEEYQSPNASLLLGLEK
ncbi:hypothetical protein ACFY2M_27995 [Streptomyces sp. NPDC001276]|uniref:hypothetical protein n=1 Tax=Streptomyces sp. NPDC001276 TaxID=3364555 RepID=UPI0036925110